MTRVTYSTIDELLIGDLTVSDTLKTKHTVDASDEIDSKLGFQYVVPFTQSSVSAPAWILIHRIANNLASGRLLLEVNQSREPAAIGYQNAAVKVVTYGQSLVDEAEGVLDMIIKGEIKLDNPSEPTTNQTLMRGARVANTDGYSQVEAFYGWASIPAVDKVIAPFLVPPNYQGR
jgi:hypothetical protein